MCGPRAAAARSRSSELTKAAIIGIEGPALLAHEAALLRSEQPLGVVLFGRNVRDPAQLRALTADLRAALPPNGHIAVDQEGGRVARLRPPHWLAHPPAAVFGRLFADDPARALRAAWLTGALIGLDCAEAGFTVVAAPVLDLSVAGTHDVIGDRAFAADPVTVARLGRAVANGLMAAGIVPVGKHAPGHGRVVVDSHLTLPRVPDTDLSQDFLPFALNSDLPWLMTAHIAYDALDPEAPATLSARVIRDVIRGRIGFKGVLVTDDLAMHALSGAPEDRATRALAAGCDIALFCPGDHDANAALLRACPELAPEAVRKLAAPLPGRLSLDRAALADERAGLLA
jgi:beta-N-acetylhexosaminidase